MSSGLEIPENPNPDFDSDSALMSQVAEGNLAAFEQLLRRYQKPAWSLAYRFIGDPAEAEDIVQRAFMNIFEAAPRYHPLARFQTYIYQVVANLCKDHRAKKRPLITDEPPHVFDPAVPADELILESQRAAAIRKALDALPAKQRIVILLRHFEGLSYEEMARVMRTTEKAVDSLLQRARHALQRILVEWK